MFMKSGPMATACAVLIGATTAGGARAAPPQNQWLTTQHPVTLSTPPAGAGALVQYADRAAWVSAMAGSELVLEGFGKGFTPASGLRICFQAVTSASNDPCFKPGDLQPGFAIRSTRGSIFDSQVRDSDVVVLGADVLGTSGPVIGSNVPGPPANPVRISFDVPVIAVGLDVYDGRTGGALDVSAFAADDTLIGSFTVTPSAINVSTFAGFTSPVPVAQVTVTATAASGGALIGALQFGGSAGRVVVDSERLDFGATAAGGVVSLPLSLSNGGDLDLAIGNLAVPPSPFSLASDACSNTTLARGQSCALQIAFEPPHGLPYAGSLTIPGSDPRAPEVELLGQGVLARLSPLPGNVDFGSVAVGGSTAANVVLANLGAATVTVSSIGTPAAPFGRDGGDCATLPFDLAPGAQCSLGLSFAPASAGNHRGVLSIGSSASNPLNVNLYGDGAAARNGGQP
jgi:hypothetical protein